MMDAEFNLTERERIRWALLAYMKEHAIGTPTLAARIKASHPREMEIPLRTLQRVLGPLKPATDEAPAPKPTRVHDITLTICKMFVDKLPNKPTAMHALGEALHAVYGQKPDIPAGTYTVMEDKTVLSKFMITASSGQFMLVKEVTAEAYRRIFDGVIVRAGSNLISTLKDRLMLTARVHILRPQQSPGEDFYDLICDNNPMEENEGFYPALQATLVRPPNAGHRQTS
jgi:hypothetical protein